MFSTRVLARIGTNAGSFLAKGEIVMGRIARKQLIILPLFHGYNLRVLGFMMLLGCLYLASLHTNNTDCSQSERPKQAHMT